MALRHLQRTLRIYSSTCSAKRKFTGMRAAIRCGVYTCQTRTMFSEWIYSRKNVDIVAPVYLKAYNYPERVAVVDHHGEHTYGKILYKSHLLSTKLLETSDFTLSSDRMPARICLLCPNNVSYVIAQWATWMAGGMVVPLCSTHPPSELKYFVEDSNCVAIMTTEDLAEKIEATAIELNKVLLVLKQDEYSIEVRTGKPEDANKEKNIPPIDARQEQWKNMLLSNKYKRMPAMIIYTSGTTGRPKGVVHTHGSLAAQMDGMTQAWEWKSTDVILHTLPLHHIHGIVNVLMTPLYNGAKCVMLPKFNAEQVWNKLLNEVNLFMAVPTIYAKLIEYYEEKHGTDSRNNDRMLNYANIMSKYYKQTLTAKVR